MTWNTDVNVNGAWSMMDADLLAEKTTEETAPVMVEGLLREGEVMMVSGGPKSGKSRFALQLALTIASEAAEDFLGRRVRTLGRVLFIDNGAREALLAERIRDMAEATGESLALLADTLSVSTQVGNPRTIEDLAELIPWMQEAGVRLVVIDSLARALDVPDQATQAMKAAALRKAYATLARYAAMCGAAFVCVHDAQEKGLTEAEGLADVRVRLLQHAEAEDALVMTVAARSFAGEGPTVLRKDYPCFAVDDEGLDPRLTEELTAAQLRTLKQENQDLAATTEDVVTALAGLDGKSYKHALQEAVQAETGCSWRVAAELLSEAIAEGRIRCTNVKTPQGRRAVLCTLPEVETVEVEPLEDKASA